jgi:hypothetical protein
VLQARADTASDEECVLQRRQTAEKRRWEVWQQGDFKRPDGTRFYELTIELMGLSNVLQMLSFFGPLTSQLLLSSCYHQIVGRNGMYECMSFTPACTARVL